MLKDILEPIEITKKRIAPREKARKSPAAISIDPNVRCQRIYPIEDTRKNVSDLKTIGIKLSKEQAIHLSRVLLAVSQEWDEVDITGYRFDKRKSDGTYHLTITSYRPEVE